MLLVLITVCILFRQEDAHQEQDQTDDGCFPGELRIHLTAAPTLSPEWQILTLCSRRSRLVHTTHSSPSEICAQTAALGFTMDEKQLCVGPQALLLTCSSLPSKQLHLFLLVQLDSTANPFYIFSRALYLFVTPKTLISSPLVFVCVSFLLHSATRY